MAKPALRTVQRESVELPIRLPTDVLRAIEQVADRLDMSPEALIRRYVGNGLREDLAKSYLEFVTDSLAHVLGRHGLSEEQQNTISADIQREAAERASLAGLSPEFGLKVSETIARSAGG